MTGPPSMNWSLYDRYLRLERVTTLNNKFTESQNQKRRKKIIFHVRVILISHVYISIFMGVSNGWKSHSG